MTELFFAAGKVQKFLEEKKWQFCFIGGVAVQRWGENRVTTDLDLTIFTNFKNDELYIKDILKYLKPRRPDALEFALSYRVLLVETDDGTPVDLSLGGLPFEEEMIRNSSYFKYLEGLELKTCSAEDLVVMKCFANRERDWIDVRGIIVRQGKSLNRDYIRITLDPLLKIKEEPEIFEKLEKLFVSLV